MPLYSAVSLKYHTYIWYPARSHYFFATGQPVFCVDLPFICRTLYKRASTTNLKSLAWLGWESNPGSPRHGATALPRGYCAGLTHDEKWTKVIAIVHLGDLILLLNMQVFMHMYSNWLDCHGNYSRSWWGMTNMKMMIIRLTASNIPKEISDIVVNELLKDTRDSHNTTHSHKQTWLTASVSSQLFLWRSKCYTANQVVHIITMFSFALINIFTAGLFIVHSLYQDYSRQYFTYNCLLHYIYIEQYCEIFNKVISNKLNLV